MRFSAFIKTAILSLTILFVLLFVKAPAFAQTVAPQPINQAQPNLVPNTNPDVPNNLHTFSQSLMLEVMSSLACDLAGRDPLNKNGQCLGLDPTTGKIGYVKNNGGAIGSVTGMIAILYTPPLHTSDFIAYMQSNFGLAKPSYAQVQGIGFTGLTPLLHAWVVFRNVVYLLFVFIFILIGLAIMLRVKIDPRTVMTIQNQIPKIIISLILVTFSFAIAGFLIDLMWISIWVVINLMGQADPQIQSLITANTIQASVYHPAPQFANDILSKNVLGGIFQIATTGAGAIADIIQKFIQPDQLTKAATTSNPGCSFFIFNAPCFITNPAADFVAAAGKGDIGGMIGALNATTLWGAGINATTEIGKDVGIDPGSVVGGAIATLVSWVVGILAFLILIIALLWALLRLWFALLKAYIMILIDVIFAPFWILSGLIPGQQSAGFSAWLRDMAGNLAAFPAAILMILLAKLFSDGFINTGAASNTTSFIPPLLAQDASNNIASLIAIGVLLATPGVVDMTKKAFKAPKVELGGTIGRAVGAGPRLVGMTAGFGMQALGVASQIKLLRGGGGITKAPTPTVAAPPEPGNQGGSGI
jgi:hypothetical protein